MLDPIPLDIAHVARKRHIEPEIITQSHSPFRCGSEPAGFVNGKTSTTARWQGSAPKRLPEDLAYAHSHRLHASREARREAQAGPRRQLLDSQINRNPFNPITGMERPGHVPDSFLPRGLAPVPTHEARDAWEHNRRMDADVRLRMFKLPNPDSASLQTRAKHIADNGIADFAAKRRSSEIGYGRPDLASAGASEAFSGAQYGGQRASDRALAESALLKQRLAAGELDDRTQMLASFQGIVPKDPWDVAVMAADPERHARRLAATTRAPNRVFDTVTAPVHLPTQPDPVQRALREIRELQSSRPGRPMDRPQAFTATAGRMASMRVQAVKQAERDMVARLTQL